MKINSGKFVSDRAIAEIFYRKEQVMCDYGAWNWLLSETAYKTHFVNYKGRKIEIQRGQLPTSIRELVKAFRWSPNRVRRFLSNTQLAGYLDISIDTGFTIITVCKYEEIQSFGNKDNTLMNTEAETAKKLNVDTNRTKTTKKKNNLGVDPSLRPNAQLKSTFKKKSQWHIILRKQLGEAVYRSWIAESYYKSGKVIFPTRFKKDWCRNNYEQQIQKALAVCGKELKGFEETETIEAGGRLKV